MTTQIIPGYVLAPKALQIAEQYIAAGIYATNGPHRSRQIDRMERVFDIVGGEECAIGVSDCALKALAVGLGETVTEANYVDVLKSMMPILQAHYFKPSASCGVIMQDAKDRGTWIEHVAGADQHFLAQLKPGDPIIFCWNPGQPNPQRHIGYWRAPQLQTCEFDTNPGTDGQPNHGEGGYLRDRLPVLKFVLGAVSFNR